MQNGYLCIEEHDCLCNLALNKLPIYVFWKDKDLVFQGCNDNFAKFIGLEKASDIIGKTDFDLVNHETATHFRAIDKMVMETKEAATNITEPSLDSNKKQIWITVNKIPLVKNGEVVGVLGMFEDITEKKSLEGELSKSEDKYKHLIEFTNTSYLIMDEKLRILDSNENFVKIMEAKNKENVIGSCLRAWVCSSQVSTFDNAFSCLLKGKKIINDLELSLTNENGNKVHVSINANLTKNGKTKIFCLMSDISSRKMIEQVEYIKKQQQKDRIRQNILNIQKQLATLQR